MSCNNDDIIMAITTAIHLFLMVLVMKNAGLLETTGLL